MNPFLSNDATMALDLENRRNSLTVQFLQCCDPKGTLQDAYQLLPEIEALPIQHREYLLLDGFDLASLKGNLSMVEAFLFNPKFQIPLTPKNLQLGLGSAALETLVYVIEQAPLPFKEQPQFHSLCLQLFYQNCGNPQSKTLPVIEFFTNYFEKQLPPSTVDKNISQTLGYRFFERAWDAEHQEALHFFIHRYHLTGREDKFKDIVDRKKRALGESDFVHHAALSLMKSYEEKLVLEKQINETSTASPTSSSNVRKI